MFEGVYITDDKNNLSYEYLVFSHVPTFSAVANTLKSKFADHSASPLQIVEINSDYLVTSYGNARFIVYLLCSTREFGRYLNPLLPFLFLDKLVETMGEYFGVPLTTLKIDANNDTLTLLLHQMIADGVPNTTDFNNLKDLVSSKSFLSKILSTGNQLASAANAKSISSITNPRTSPFASASETSKSENRVPWRSANVRYTNNEMFVDVVESLNVILTPKARSKRYSRTQNFDSAFYSTSGATSVPSNQLSVLSGTISGKLEFLSHISGVPELQILFNSAASYLDSPRFHQCIDLAAWQRSKTLSFVPADGRSVLMNYALDLDEMPAKTRSKMLGLVEFDYEAGLGLDANEMELRIHTAKDHTVAKIETIQIEVFAHEPSNGSSEPSEITGMKSIRVTDGDFRYKGSGSGVWTIQNLQTGSHPVLRLAIKSSRTDDDMGNHQPDLIHLSAEKPEPLRPVWFRVNFMYKGQVPSGLKIDSMKVIKSSGMGDSVKPYKGVKYITNCADYTIRC